MAPRHRFTLDHSPAMTAIAPDPLFPPLEPYRSGLLPVDELHTLYWEECGNPQGVPVLFLHGGPGAGLSPLHRRFFDPAHYRIVLFDQRGAGRSTPLGECRNNSTPLLVQDIERLRVMFGIDQWLLFGGSWGSTLALAYGQTHPERCTGFVLRGIFLCTAAEMDWFLHGMGQFFPQAHAQFVERIPPGERSDLLQAYLTRMFSDDPVQSAAAARAWGRYEGSCLHLRPQPEAAEEFGSDTVGLALGRLEAHYFAQRGFFSEDQLIRGMARIRHLPAVIVQGRYDVVCPPITAYRLHQAWPGSQLHLIDDAGHAAMEPGTAAALVAATQAFKTH
jgi:proline iminopeptidase